MFHVKHCRWIFVCCLSGNDTLVFGDRYCNDDVAVCFCLLGPDCQTAVSGFFYRFMYAKNQFFQIFCFDFFCRRLVFVAFVENFFDVFFCLPYIQIVFYYVVEHGFSDISAFYSEQRSGMPFRRLFSDIFSFSSALSFSRRSLFATEACVIDNC